MVAIEREAIAADVYPFGTLSRHHQVFSFSLDSCRSRAPEPGPAHPPGLAGADDAQPPRQHD